MAGVPPLSLSPPGAQSPAMVRVQKANELFAAYDTDGITALPA